MATLSNNTIARAIYLSSQKDGVQAREFYPSVIQFFSKKHLWPRVPAILSELEKVANEDHRTLSVRLKSSEHLPEETKHNLARALKKRYGEKVAEKVVFQEQIDPKLLGGVRMEIGDDVIDLSVKNKVNQLKEYLIRS